MKIYIAANLREKSRAIDVRSKLLLRGHESTSTWMDVDSFTPEAEMSTDEMMSICARCYAEMDASDGLLLLTCEFLRNAIGEACYVAGCRKPVWIVGRICRPALILNAPGVMWFPTADSALIAIGDDVDKNGCDRVKMTQARVKP